MFPIIQNQNLKRVQYLVKAFMYSVQIQKWVRSLFRFDSFTVSHISSPLPSTSRPILVLACARVLVCARRQSKGSFFGHEPALSYV